MPPRINRHFFYNYCPRATYCATQNYLVHHLELPSTPPRITQHSTQNVLAHHLELPSTPPRMSQHITQNYLALHLECPSTPPRITQDQVLELPAGKEGPQAESLEVVAGEALEEVLRQAVVTSQQVHTGVLHKKYILREAAAATNIYPLRTAPPVVLILSCLYQPLSACSVCSYTDRQVVQCTAGRAKKGGEWLGEATEGAVRSQRIYSYILCGSL